jgi:hypothetical protein
MPFSKKLLLTIVLVCAQCIMATDTIKFRGIAEFGFLSVLSHKIRVEFVPEKVVNLLLLARQASYIAVLPDATIASIIPFSVGIFAVVGGVKDMLLEYRLYC